MPCLAATGPNLSVRDRVGALVPRRVVRRTAAGADGNGRWRRLAPLLGLVVAALAVVAALWIGRPGPTVPTARQVGLASWYGPGFYGRRTAGGVVFTGAGMTAAHRSLPLGTRVRVTNLANGRQAVVVVDDRGPYRGNRVIDLSPTAARHLGMVRAGVVKVRVEVLD